MVIQKVSNSFCAEWESGGFCALNKVCDYNLVIKHDKFYVSINRVLIHISFSIPRKYICTNLKSISRIIDGPEITMPISYHR